MEVDVQLHHFCWVHKSDIDVELATLPYLYTNVRLKECSLSTLTLNPVKGIHGVTLYTLILSKVYYGNNIYMKFSVFPDIRIQTFELISLWMPSPLSFLFFYPMMTNLIFVA